MSRVEHVTDNEIRHVLGEGRVLRDDQIDVVQNVLAAYRGGKKWVILSAPTGSGKSFIGRAVSLLMGRTGYVTPSKTLQDQLHRDFPEGIVVKGHAAVCRRDYNDHRETRRFKCECRTRDGGRYSGTRSSETYHRWNTHYETLEDLDEPKAGCSYMVAKIRALQSNFYIGNVAVLAMDCRTDRRLLSDRQLMIMDECDTLYADLDGQVHVEEEPLAGLMQAGWALPDPDGPTMTHIDVSHSLGWAAYHLEQKAAGMDPSGREEVDGMTRGRMIFAAAKLRALAAYDDPSRFVYVWDEENLYVNLLSPGAAAALIGLWEAADRFLLMSASVVNARNWARNLGILSDELEIIEVPSTFPVDNRGVHLVNSGLSMAGGGFNNRTKMDRMADMIAALLGTIDSGDRALVLVTSGKQSADLARELSKRVPSRQFLTYGNGDARGRSRALELSAETPGSVLLGQSLHRGVDLKDDLCRLLIVAKLPWPFLGDRIVSQRSKAQDFKSYIMELMVAEIVQAVGRGVRGPQDWCRTYVLDYSDYAFAAISGMAPAYVKEAIKYMGKKS